MGTEEALEFVEAQLRAQKKSPLTDLQRAVFRGCWQDKDYKEIRRDLDNPPTEEHIKRNVGPALWKLLREILQEPGLSKKNLRGSIERAKNRFASPEPNDFPSEQPFAREKQTEELPNPWVPPIQDWSHAPDTSHFYGRERELETLRKWLTLEGCRLILIHGIAGIGKTMLATKLAQDVRRNFDFIIWRSLTSGQFSKNSPILEQLQTNLVEALSGSRSSEKDQLDFSSFLKKQRCLIVLDGLEVVLSARLPNNSYTITECEDWLAEMGRSTHQSCLLLTSREEPKKINLDKSDKGVIRSLRLDKLGELAAKDMLLAKGRELYGSERDWERLVGSYYGNPFLLNVAASRILEMCGGRIGQFLTPFHQTALEGIDMLLHEQLNLLPTTERIICDYLYQQAQPLTVTDLENTNLKFSSREMITSLESLRRKSLIRFKSDRYSLHPLVIAYLNQS